MLEKPSGKYIKQKFQHKENVINNKNSKAKDTVQYVFLTETVSNNSFPTCQNTVVINTTRKHTEDTWEKWHEIPAHRKMEVALKYLQFFKVSDKKRLSWN